MTHEELRERLLDLAYGELSRREARRVEAHAASCDACRAELARIRETRRLMSALPQEAAPEAGERILLAAAREAARARTRRSRLPAWLWGGAATAVSLAAVAAVSYRLLAMRPGPLERQRTDVLLGDSPYARAPAPVSPEPAEPRPEAGEPPQRRRERPVRRGDASTDAERAPSGPDHAEGAGAFAARGQDDAGARPPPAPRGAEGAEAFAVRPEDGAAERAGAPGDEAPAASQPPSAGSGPRAEAAPAPSQKAEGRERAAAGEEARAPDADAGRGGTPRAPPAAAPSRAAAKGAARTAAPEPAAGAAVATPAALLRYEELRRAGRLRGDIRTFTGCEGEAWRKVETDPGGRVVKYVREGRIGGRRLRVEHVYGEDGALAVATVRDLDRAGETLDADALGLALPPRASEASIDAPPRCGR